MQAGRAHDPPTGQALLEPAPLAPGAAAHRATTWRGKALETLGSYRVKRAHRFELARTTDPETGEVRYVDATLTDDGELCLGEEAWEQWYDHVLHTVKRARDFDYIFRDEPVEGQDYAAPTVPNFLNLCASMSDEDMAFFRDEDPHRTYAEIGWPHLSA